MVKEKQESLKDLRDEQKVSMRMAARRGGWRDHRTILHIEQTSPRTSNTTIRSLIRYARAIGVDPMKVIQVRGLELVEEERRKCEVES